VSPEKAFGVLRRYSQQQNIKLHEVAATLVRTGALPGEQGRPTDDAQRRA